VVTDYIDYSFPKYNETPELYDSVGWNENDTNLIMTRNYNSKVFSEEAITKIVNTNLSDNDFVIKEAVVSFKNAVQRYGATFLMIWPMFMMMFLIDKKHRWAHLCHLAIAIMSFIGYSYMRRVLIRNLFPVTCILMVMTFLYLTLATEKSSEKPKVIWKGAKFAVSAVIFLLFVRYTAQSPVYHINFAKEKSSKIETDWRDGALSGAVKHIEDNKDKVFYVDSNFFASSMFELSLDRKRLWFAPKKNQFDNVVIMGDCYSRLESSRQIAKKYNGEEPFEAVVLNENSYLLVRDGTKDRILNHIRDHFMDFKINSILEIGEHTIYELSPAE